jgi:hypothetical protein
MDESVVQKKAKREYDMLIARASEMTTIKNFGNGTAALPVKLRKNTPTSSGLKRFLRE